MLFFPRPDFGVDVHENVCLSKRWPSDRVRFEGFLKNRKLKVTLERMVIAERVLRSSSHFDAETLHEELRAKGISRATVYRTLDLLVQAGLVRKSHLGASHANYEIVMENEHHDHLICLRCGKVVEFFCCDLEVTQERISQEHGFQVFHHTLQIFGLCPDCTGKMDDEAVRNRVAQLRL